MKVDAENDLHGFEYKTFKTAFVVNASQPEIQLSEGEQGEQHHQGPDLRGHVEAECPVLAAAGRFQG